MGYIEIKVIDFTSTPGTRYRSEGPFSGEEYRETIIEPAFLEAIKNNSIVKLNLDGPFGYGTSFLEEVFGGLARNYGAEKVLKAFTFISKEEPYLIEDIAQYVKDTEK